MSILNKRRCLCFMAFFCLLNSYFIFAQDSDTTKSPAQFRFSAVTTITNNGISLLPTFSLGKPAAIFELSMGSKRWSFDPQFRFSMEGRPWSFIFWGRYKLVDDKKFRLTVGAHPAISFKKEYVTTLNDEPKQIMNSYRFLASEFAPNLTLTKNITVGMYFLYAHGLDVGSTANTHFVTLNSSFSNLKLFSETYLKVQPQLYYLKMDSKDGYYFSSTVTLTNKKVPLAISSVINKVIDTDIKGKDFIWNLSLIYSFNNNYVKK